MSMLHYAHPKPIVGQFFFEGTVTGDSYVKILDEEVFPSILNEINDFVLLYSFKCSYLKLLTNIMGTKQFTINILLVPD